MLSIKIMILLLIEYLVIAAVAGTEIAIGKGTMMSHGPIILYYLSAAGITTAVLWWTWVK